MVLQVLPMIDALRRAIAIVQGKEVLLQSWPSHQSLCIKSPVVVRSTTDGANGWRGAATTFLKGSAHDNVFLNVTFLLIWVISQLKLLQTGTETLCKTNPPFTFLTPSQFARCTAPFTSGAAARRTCESTEVKFVLYFCLSHCYGMWWFGMLLLVFQRNWSSCRLRTRRLMRIETQNVELITTVTAAWWGPEVWISTWSSGHPGSRVTPVRTCHMSSPFDEKPQKGSGWSATSPGQKIFFLLHFSLWLQKGKNIICIYLYTHIHM